MAETWPQFTERSPNSFAISFDTRKVLDFQYLTKYCNVCKQYETTKICQEHRNICKANFAGRSAGIFHRSVSKLGVRYMQYLGDGNSKSFAKGFESKPYGCLLYTSRCV